MNTEIYSLNKISDSKSGPAVIYISAGAGGEETQAMYKSIREILDTEFVLYELKVTSWDDYLSPWPMEMGNRSFKGNAKALLNCIVDEIIPAVRSVIGVSEKIYIAGYSLAGLFALWSLYESNVFSGAVSCSGSLWYQGWIQYINENKLNGKVKIYLSLGDKEKNTKNEFMSKVEENTLIQKELLLESSEVVDVFFEMNKGGHFSDITGRMSKGIKWILS